MAFAVVQCHGVGEVKKVGWECFAVLLRRRDSQEASLFSLLDAILVWAMFT